MKGNNIFEPDKVLIDNWNKEVYKFKCMLEDMAYDYNKIINT